MARVGVIGTGEVGCGLCARVRLSGHHVAAFDRRADALNEAARRGATPTRSVAEAARGCEFAIVCVGDEEEVENVVLASGGLAEAMPTGSVLIEATGSKPSVARRIGAVLAERRIGVVDAQTDRGAAVAGNGTMSVMVGGDKDVFERCRPIIETFGADVSHVGPLGSAHTVQALNMLALGAALVATAEAVNVASRAGVAPEKFIDALNASSGGSCASDVHFPALIRDERRASGLTLGLMEKHLRIGVETAHEAGIPAPMAERVLAVYRMLVARLGPAADNARVASYLDVLGSR